MGINARQIYSGKNMTVSALKDEHKGKAKLKITGFKLKRFSGDNKIVLSFDAKDTRRVLVLNNENNERLCDMFGDDPDKWVGKTISLGIEETDFNGEPTDSVRVTG